MKILALGGYTGAGKSELAKLLLKDYPHLLFKPPHIKTPMMEMAIPFLRRLGVPEHMMMYYLDDPIGKVTPIPGWPHITGKLVLQVIGKPFRDGVDPTGDIFALLWKIDTLKLAEVEKKHALMESLRFPNEVRVLSPEVITVWVDRPGVEPRGDEFEPRLDTEYVIHNNQHGNPVHMLNQAVIIMQQEGFFNGMG